MTHYDMLGVSPSASADDIRAAYRRAVRRVHPDAGAAGSGAEIAALSEAWRVLGDPARREAYDRDLREPRAAVDDRSMPERAPVAEPRFNPLAPYQSPPRFPWRPMGVMAAVGTAVVILGVVTFHESAPKPPDNLLQPGSCVTVEPDGDAVEVACVGAHDLIVARLVAFDERCPTGEAGHRDAQGLGIACLLAP